MVVHMKICNNVLLAIGVVAIAVTEMVALATGHNGEYFNLAMGAMVVLAGGAPTLQGIRGVGGKKGK